MNTKIMANDNNKEPKVHGSGSMYVDAAIEALQQEKKEHEDFSFILIATNGDRVSFAGEGTPRDIVGAIATNMKTSERFANMVKKAVAINIMDEKGHLGKFEQMLKDFDKAKENPSDAFKGFMDRIKNKKE